MSSIYHLQGIDAAEGIRRAGNSPELYVRFLKRFPKDPSFRKLTEALETGDIRQAFLSAHTLKGLSAQLCLHTVFAHACALCELLRPQNPQALSSARSLLCMLTAEYHAVITQILTLP